MLAGGPPPNENPRVEEKMAYKRTIYCRACGTAGHNRASCPTLAARIEELRGQYGSDHWQVSNYDAKRKRSTTRTCSYCRGTDHNRAACPVMKNDASRARPHIVAWRKSFIDNLCKIGQVPGTIAVHRHSSELSNMYLIEKVNYDKVGPWTSAGDCLVVRGLSLIGPGKETIEERYVRWYINDRGSLPWTLHSFFDYDNQPRVDTVVAAGCTEAFRKSIPKSWMDAENIDFLFENNRNAIGRNNSTFAQYLNDMESGRVAETIVAMNNRTDRFIEETGFSLN
jgi:hypothetical protein